MSTFCNRKKGMRVYQLSIGVKKKFLIINASVRGRKHDFHWFIWEQSQLLWVLPCLQNASENFCITWLLRILESKFHEKPSTIVPGSLFMVTQTFPSSTGAVIEMYSSRLRTRSWPRLNIPKDLWSRANTHTTHSHGQLGGSETPWLDVPSLLFFAFCAMTRIFL